MGIFDNIDLEDANKVKDRRVFVRFASGRTKAEIVQTGAMKSFKNKQPYFLADFRVIETSDPTLSPGDIVNYSKSPLTEWGLKEVRNLLVAASGLQPGNPDDQDIIDGLDWAAAIRRASNHPNALAGATLFVDAEPTTSDMNRPYVKLTFSTTSENRQGRLNATREQREADSQTPAKAASA